MPETRPESANGPIPASAEQNDLPPGFKMTELGPLPEEWEVAPFDECIRRVRVSVGKVAKGRYQPTGLVPVVDQGHAFIAGYVDDPALAYQGALPVIIFGDHTRVFKLVDFPFACGADGTKVLVPDTARFEPRFLFYALSSLEIESRGYNRHYALLRRQSVPRPPLPEQRKIAAVLDTIRRAIEATDKVIAATKELKKSLMRHLFTYGPVPYDQADQVPLKETDIGPMPEGWEVEPLGGSIALMRNGLTCPQNTEGKGFPITRIETISDDRVNPLRVRFAHNLSPETVERYRLSYGDILFSHINSEPQIGRSAIYEGHPPVLLHGMNLLLIRAHGDRYHPPFLNYLFQRLRSQGVFVSLAARAVGQASINQGKLKALRVQRPPLPEQRRIAEALSHLDRQVEVQQRRKSALESLFKTVLHLLMTGQVRVKDWDFVEATEGSPR